MTSKFTTPKGTAVYPSLTKPDTRFNPEGTYKTGISMSKEDAQPIIDQLKEVFVEEFGAKKLTAAVKFPYKVEDDGSVVFNFKTQNAPKLFDAKGNPIKNASKLNIGGGSVIRCQCAAKAYNKGGNTGVTAYLNAVQIIELVEYTGNPFGVEEGGFEAAAQEKFSDSAEEEEINF